MQLPLEKLYQWLEDESLRGNVFPQGAVLATVSKDGFPRSRMVSTMLDKNYYPKFHMSKTSRKFGDIEFRNKASLTYSFQNSLRSVTIEGFLTPINSIELDEDWLRFDWDFRRHYVIFGENSGNKINSIEHLRKKRDTLAKGVENARPDSFVGCKFLKIDRVSFYTVIEGDFAKNILYEKEASGNEWKQSILVP